jgi:hypothetical protein
MVLEKKQKLLIGLAVLLALALIYRLATPYRQPTVAKLTYGRTNPVAAAPANGSDSDAARPPTKIQTALLTAPALLESKVLRDPFRRPEPKTAPRPPEQRPEAPEALPWTPDERAKEQLGRFKAFGDRTSLFLQRGKQVLVVTIGDRIDGRFAVESIDGRGVLVTAPDIPEPIRFEFEELPSDGSRPLARSSGSTGGLTPSRSLRNVAPEESEAEFQADEDAEEAVPENDAPPPELPNPPPVDDPVQPFVSSGSPSRSYLPGTKPPD